MAIYIFRCQKDPGWFALTKDRGGRYLPSELAPWRTNRRNAISIIVKETAAAAVHDERIARAIETDGYYLFRDSSGS